MILAFRLNKWRFGTRFTIKLEYEGDVEDIKVILWKGIAQSMKISL